jgi:hypothetical protein
LAASDEQNIERRDCHDRNSDNDGQPNGEEVVAGSDAINFLSCP